MENLYKTQKVYNNMACLIDLHGPEIIKMFCNTSFIKKKKKLDSWDYRRFYCN
jgi:hypothetical protein